MRARSAIIGCVTLVACTGAGADDKVGNPAPPVELTLVTNDPVGRPGAALVERFVAAVDEASGGRVTITPTFDHPAEQAPAWDQANIRALLDGRFDLAVVPTRAWRTYGVSSLEPLQLPFVVETDEQADRIAVDPSLNELLFDGLGEIDVTGLGLYPESLRHLVRVDGRPIDASAELDELTVRAPLSVTTWSVLEALGASVVDLNGPDVAQAVASGDVEVLETSLLLADGVNSTGAPSVLLSVPLYTKFNVLVATDATLAGLDVDTVAVLRDAATATLAATLSDRVGASSALLSACAEEVTTTLSSETELRAIRQRLAPVVADIVAETGTAAIVEKVREVAGEPADKVTSGCPTIETPVTIPPPIAPADLRPIAGDLPNGTYRYEIDPDMILAEYPDFPKPPEWYSGVFTIVLDDGHYTSDVVAADGTTVHYENVYQVDGDVVTSAVPSGADFNTPITVRSRWTVGDDGSLSFEPFSAMDRGERVDFADLGTIPEWERIG